MTSCVAVQALRMCYLPSVGRERAPAREVGAQDRSYENLDAEEGKEHTSLLRQK